MSFAPGAYLKRTSLVPITHIVAVPTDVSHLMALAAPKDAGARPLRWPCRASPSAPVGSPPTLPPAFEAAIMLYVPKVQPMIPLAKAAAIECDI